MDLTDAYLSEEQATAIITALLAPSDPKRLAWEDMDANARERHLGNASDQIDSVRVWGGAQAEADQPRLFPRREPNSSALINPDTRAEPIGDERLPWQFKKGVAIQAAWLANAELGGDPHGHTRESAAVGVVSQSAGGASESVDLRTAREAWSRLCGEAQGLLTRYRSASFVGV